MDKKHKLFVENGKTAPEILLDVLLEEQMISESAFKLVSSVEILTEAQNTHSTVYYKGRPIHRDVFFSVYSDFRRYESHADVAAALGFTPNDFGDDDQRRKQNMSKFIQRTVKTFNRNRLPEDQPFPRFDQRQSFYSGADSDDMDFGFGDATIDDIEAGSRNRRDRTTRALDKINSQELLDGEFYSNMTRIPKTRWASWLRFWDRKKSSVKNDRSLFGREWKKHFIMGYQIEPRVLYEIWYNSIDSTFTVHDVGGAEMSSRARTMTEAIRNLVNMIAQTSEADAEIFRGSNQDARQVALSITAALHDSTDRRAKELEKVDMKKQKERRAERIAAIRSKKEAKSTADANFEKFRKAFAVDEVNDEPNNARETGDEETPLRGRDDPDWVKKQNAQEKRRREKEAELVQRREARKQKQREDLWNEIDGGIKKYGDDGNPDYLDIPSMGKKPSKRRKSQSEMSQDEVRKRIEKARKELAKGGTREVTESIDFEELEDLDSRTYESQIKEIKRGAENSPYTQMALKQTAMANLLTTYTDRTKAKKSSFGNVMARILNRGRVDPVVLPTDKTNIIKRSLGDLIMGRRYRADFIIGWSLGGTVNMEVWYVTEPHPDDKNRTIASFYVFDVTSSKVIRQFLPYYRNAVQVVISKIGAV